MGFLLDADYLNFMHEEITLVFFCLFISGPLILSIFLCRQDDF